jgi:hypothetical protein
MLNRRTAVLSVVAAAFVAAVSAATLRHAQAPTPVASTLPARLSDQEFWRLSESFSEATGVFHSDNFVSNEGRFQSVIPELVSRVAPGGVYFGVGPEQNFTYIAATRPRMVFIVDLRRGNLHEHLLYKALMEMSASRAEFLSKLFLRKQPASIGPTSTTEQLFAAYDAVAPTEAAYQANYKAVIDWLTKRHTLALRPEDPEGIDYVYRNAFFAEGPALGYRLTGSGRVGGALSYAELMTMTDPEGKQRSYLASEANFAFLKDLQSKNLIVPVVGNFGGPKALRAVGRWVRDHGALVTTFYVSNVEQYLRQDDLWSNFCATVATFPLDRTSTFIRTVRGGGRNAGGIGMFTSSLVNMQAETRACGGRPSP